MTATTAPLRGPASASLRRVVAVTFAAGVLVSLLGARFLFYSGAAASPTPSIEVPADDAVRALQQRASSAPEDPGAWQALGVGATRQAIATADPAWYAVAVDAFDRAVALDAEDPLTTIGRGELALSLHDFPGALSLGLEATEAAPDTAAAWGVVVDARIELGQYEDAASALQRMLDLRPDLPALARASYLRQLNGDLDGAVLALRQAEAAGGGQVFEGSVVAGLLGEVLLQRGDLDGAEAAFLRASTPAAAVGVARIAAARGELDAAVEILSDVVERAPSATAITALAELQQRVGDDEGLASTVALGRTVAVLQQDAGQTVDLELALFEASFGDASLAVDLARSAYDARPDNVFAQGALAWALFRAGDVAQARPLASAALRLGTVDTALELRMAEITGTGLDELLERNPLAEELYLP